MFELPELPYSINALEPTISARTLEFHHGKHHAGYVKALNVLLAAMPGEKSGLEGVISDALDMKDAKLFNNAAQCWNHSFFWKSMSDVSSEPSPELRAAVNKAFGDLAGLKIAISDEGVSHFGSGWVWLTADRNGDLKVTATHDAHDLLTDSAVTPLLVCDLWEHAYYLDHQNNRAGFLEAWFDALPNWSFASAQFEAAKSGATGWRHPGPVLRRP